MQRSRGTGPGADLRREFDRWDRRATVAVAHAPYALLTAATLITLSAPAPVDLPLALGLSAAAAAWTAWFLTLRPARQEQPRLMQVYYAGMMLFAAALVAVAPWYGLYAFAGYPHAYTFLRGRLRYAGAAATSLPMVVTYLGGLARTDAGDWWLAGIIYLASTAMAAACFAAMDTIECSALQQQEALAGLHKANTTLESALEENADLHAQLLTQARAAGVLDERQRIAREIHDTLAQGLAGILTQLQAAEADLAAPDSRRRVATAMALARENLAEARRTVRAVAPAPLADAAGLPDAVGGVVRRWREAHGIAAAADVAGDPCPLPAETEAALLRAAQEALANVAKHARAGRVGVTLTYLEDGVALDVRDDGVGFDPGSVPEPLSGSGFGLAGMRQRIERLGGRFAVESEAGSGTALSVSVPAAPAGGAR